MSFVFKGVKFKIGFLFVATVAVLLCFNTGIQIQFAVLFALLHEAGHLFAIVISGEKPESISFGLFGMTIIRQNDITQNFKQEVFTALAGPLTNFTIALILLCFWYEYKSDTLIIAISVNIILGLFNIMPVFSLDGGNALDNYLKLKYEDDKCEKILRIVSLCCLTIMMAFGFYILIVSKYNFTFLIITIYLTVMLFVKT